MVFCTFDEEHIRTGVTDQYVNLKSLLYVITPVLSAEAFINALTLVFGDKTSAEKACAALDKCKQGFTSIVDYNSWLGPLGFQVRQHEDNAIIKYVNGHHPDVCEECINVLGWNSAKTLAKKMNLAVEGAGREAGRGSFPNRAKCPNVYQHPNKIHMQTVPIIHPTPIVPKQVAGPVPVQIEAVQMRDTSQRNPFSEIRSV